MPRRNNRSSLLTPQHRMRDLRCIGQVGDPRFHHFDTRNTQPLIDLPFQRSVDLVKISAQRDSRFLVFEVIIGISSSQLAYSRVSLDPDKVGIVVHRKAGLIGILYLPDKDHADHNRIAQLVVHLFLFTLEITGTQGYIYPLIEWIDPEQSALPDAATIGAE